MANYRETHSPGARTTAGPLYLLVGIPGSGKTTWRRRVTNGMTCVCPDDIRWALHGTPFDPAREPQVWRTVWDRLETALATGDPVVLDATNVSPERRAPAVAAARRHGAPVVAIVFPVPLEVARRRNRLRPRPVPDEVLERMTREFTWPEPGEGIDMITVAEPVDEESAADLPAR